MWGWSLYELTSAGVKNPTRWKEKHLSKMEIHLNDQSTPVASKSTCLRYECTFIISTIVMFLCNSCFDMGMFKSPVRQVTYAQQHDTENDRFLTSKFCLLFFLFYQLTSNRHLNIFSVGQTNMDSRDQKSMSPMSI